MYAAVDAVADLTAPPPQRAASSAGLQQADGPSPSSFQDHLSASNQPGPAAPLGDAPTHAANQPISEPVDRAAVSKAGPPSSAPTQAPSDNAAPQAHPPWLVQLIASSQQMQQAAAPSAAEEPKPAAGRQLQQAPAEQRAPSASASVLATQLATPDAAALNGEFPAKPAQPKSQHAKATTEKPSTNAASAESAPALPEQAPAATTPAIVAAPVVAPPPQLDAKQATSKSDAAIGAIQANPSRPGAPDPSPASPPAAPAPDLAKEGAPTQKPDTAATERAAPPKTAAPIDAVKQVAQDFGANHAAASPASASASPILAAQTVATDPGPVRPSTASAAMQVGSEIVRRFNGADTSFQMRLDPPDLGRVDVRLEISSDHRVTAVISAENPQALSDLSRGARDLQQALQSAGLDLGDDSLRFNLSSGGQDNSFAQADQSNNRPAPAFNTAPAATPEPVVTRPLSINSWRGTRIDLVA